ncbi:MAG: preprotein translocase subunit SecG [Chitinophagaceae bacterium]
MLYIVLILIIIVCAVLAFFVLIQNPKGGGLAGTFGGLGTQMMGAKQSTDVVEKGTWYTAAALLVLTLLSFAISPKENTGKIEKTRSEKVNKGVPITPATAPATSPATAPAEGTTPPATAPAEGAAPSNAPASTPQ